MTQTVNWGNVIIAVGVVGICMIGFAASLISYFRLQQHRADAVAMAGYRKLAEREVESREQILAQFSELSSQITALDSRIAGIEALLRSIG